MANFDFSKILANPKYSEAFKKTVQIILKSEGGLIDDPDDPGGLTKYGISSQSYGHLDIRNLTLEDAAEIYYTDYWRKVRGDDIAMAVNWKLAGCVCDHEVNRPPGIAIRLLQEIIGATPDGIIGPKTIAKLENQMDPGSFLESYKIARLENYRDYISGNVKRRKFCYQWMHRTLKWK